MTAKSAQETIEYYIKKKGMTKSEAIKEIEDILHGKLPESVLRTLEAL